MKLSLLLNRVVLIIVLYIITVVECSLHRIRLLHAWTKLDISYSNYKTNSKIKQTNYYQYVSFILDCQNKKYFHILKIFSKITYIRSPNYLNPGEMRLSDFSFERLPWKTMCGLVHKT